MKEKRCGRCNIVQLAEYFYPRSAKGDGLTSYCKKCSSSEGELLCREFCFNLIADLKAAEALAQRFEDALGEAQRECLESDADLEAAEVEIKSLEEILTAIRETRSGHEAMLEAEVERLTHALYVYHDRIKEYPELRNLVGADVLKLSQDSYDTVRAEAQASLEKS